MINRKERHVLVNSHFNLKFSSCRIRTFNLVGIYSLMGEIPFYPTFYWIPFYPTLIFTILSNLFQKYHFIQLSMVVSKYRFIQLFLTFFDLKRFWLRFKNKLISAIRRCIKYGEKYIRTKVCSEHMFGTNLNFGKHIFGTKMFGKWMIFGKFLNFGTWCFEVRE